MNNLIFLIVEVNFRFRYVLLWNDVFDLVCEQFELFICIWRWSIGSDLICSRVIFALCLQDFFLCNPITFLLGYPLCFLYSRISSFLVHNNLLDSVYRVSLSVRLPCFLVYFINWLFIIVPKLRELVLSQNCLLVCLKGIFVSMDSWSFAWLVC